jgi:hypothetical protein
MPRKTNKVKWLMEDPSIAEADFGRKNRILGTLQRGFRATGQESAQCNFWAQRGHSHNQKQASNSISKPASII